MANPVIKTVPFHMLYLEKGEQVYLININFTFSNSSSITSLEELITHRHEALANLPSEYHDYCKALLLYQVLSLSFDSTGV